MVIAAWFMDDDETDQRCPHQKTPNESVDLPTLDSLGILSWTGLTGAGN